MDSVVATLGGDPAGTRIAPGAATTPTLPEGTTVTLTGASAGAPPSDAGAAKEIWKTARHCAVAWSVGKKLGGDENAARPETSVVAVAYPAVHVPASASRMLSVATTPGKAE